VTALFLYEVIGLIIQIIRKYTKAGLVFMINFLVANIFIDGTKIEY
jgi:hypothetical protein